MTSVLEARVVISGLDESGKAFDSLKTRVNELSRSVKTINTASAEVGRISGQIDQTASVMARATKAVDVFTSSMGRIEAMAPTISHMTRATEGMGAAIDAAAQKSKRLEEVKPSIAATAETSKKASVEVKALMDKSLRLAEAAGKAMRFEAAQQSVAELRKGFRDAQVELGKLTKEMNRTETPTPKMTRAYEEAQRLVSRTNAAYEEEARKIMATKAELEAMAGIPYKSATGFQAALNAEIGHVEQEMRREGTVMAEIARENHRKVTGALAAEQAAAARRANRSEAFGMTTAFLGMEAEHKFAEFVHSTLETYKDYDHASRFQRAVMGITAEEQAPLVQQAIRVGGTTPFNDIQVLESQLLLAQRNLKRDQILGAIGPAADLAMATSKTLPEATAMMESAIFSLKKPAETLEQIMASARQTADIQVKAVKTFGMSPEDVKMLYEYGAPTARSAGLSESLLLTFGGILKRALVPGETSGVAFRALGGALLSPTRKARETMLANGLDYSNYQKAPDHLDTGGFVKVIQSAFGVRPDAETKAALDKLFHDKALLADAAKFAPAVVDLLRDQLEGNDAKSLKGIAAAATRYRAGSMRGVDVDRLFVDLMRVVGKNPAMANEIFGVKQGGRISTVMAEKEMVEKMQHVLVNESAGYAHKIAEELMKGFDGAVRKLEGSIKNAETAVGRAWGEDEKGNPGPLVDVTNWAASLAQHFAELDRATLRTVTAVGGLAAIAGGAWGAYKLGGMFLGFGNSLNVKEFNAGVATELEAANISLAAAQTFAKAVGVQNVEGAAAAGAAGVASAAEGAGKGTAPGLWKWPGAEVGAEFGWGKMLGGTLKGGLVGWIAYEAGRMVIDSILPEKKPEDTPGLHNLARDLKALAPHASTPAEVERYRRQFQNAPKNDDAEPWRMSYHGGDVPRAYVQNIAYSTKEGVAQGVPEGAGQAGPQTSRFFALTVTEGVLNGLMEATPVAKALVASWFEGAAGGALGGPRGGIINASYNGGDFGGGGAMGSDAFAGGSSGGGRWHHAGRSSNTIDFGGGDGGATPSGDYVGGRVAGGLLQRGLAAMRYLVEKKGWTPEGAAIAIGNAEQESRVSAGGATGDGGSAHRMFQWRNERWAAFQQFLEATGRRPDDFYANLDFMDEERKGRTGLERNWHAQTDLSNAAQLGHLYEGYGDNSTANRVRAARNWLRLYRSGAAAPPADAAPERGTIDAVFGDSIAHRVKDFAGVHLPGVARDSMNPSWVLDAIRGYRGRLFDKTVALSSGMSNDVGQLAQVEEQLKLLQSRGAHTLLMGVGDLKRFAGVNEELQGLAHRYGAKFVPLRDLDADGVHPNARSQLRALREATKPSPTRLRELTGPGAKRDDDANGWLRLHPDSKAHVHVTIEADAGLKARGHVKHAAGHLHANVGTSMAEAKPLRTGRMG